MIKNKLKTLIFLDSGDPAETKQLVQMIGFLDGQTTNPSLVSKNPEVQKHIASGKKFGTDELNGFYKEMICEISNLIPQGSISIEVYADRDTSATNMLSQAEKMYTWIPNAHIKFPTTHEGLLAAHQAVKSGMRVNMTLCFTLAQSAAVYAATSAAQKGAVLHDKFAQVFISPFVGRIDDIRENGMDYIENTLRLYKNGDGHVQVLAASIRNLDHLLQSFYLQADIVTAPYSVYKTWKEMGMMFPDESYSYTPSQSLKKIPYQDLNLEDDWQTFQIENQLLTAGVDKFAEDWKKLLS